jgi:hypothetical protein
MSTAVVDEATSRGSKRHRPIDVDEQDQNMSNEQNKIPRNRTYALCTTLRLLPLPDS